ncbi:hypothetical protein ACX0E7_14360, partial [Enterococcus faecium]
MRRVDEDRDHLVRALAPMRRPDEVDLGDADDEDVDAPVCAEHVVRGPAEVPPIVRARTRGRVVVEFTS